MDYKLPDLPLAVSRKKILAFAKDIGLDPDMICTRGIRLGTEEVTVSVFVLDEDGKQVIEAGKNRLITKDVVIPIAADS